MTNNNICVIIPTFNLTGDRLNNFSYTLNKISEIQELNINVVEQTSTENNIETLVKKYPRVNYLRITTESSEIFNKSILINSVAKTTTSEFCWIIDADFYADYKFISTLVSKEYDFICPFEKVVLLNDEETYQLISHDNVYLNKQQNTNTTIGKYSFIVKTSVFRQSNYMNEDFIGWGFQDLDFVENRLIDCKKIRLSNIAFHLYHKPASRKYVNRNKKLYLNIKDNIDIKLKPRTDIELVKQEKKQNLVKKINETTEHEKICKTQNYTKKIHTKIGEKTKQIKVSHIHHTSKKRNYLIDFDISKCIESHENYHKVYFDFIISNYESLSGDYIFSSDVFSKVFLSAKNEFKKINNSSFTYQFKWISSSKHIKICKDTNHVDMDIDKSDYTFDDWLELYGIKKEYKSSIKCSIPGIFYVDSFAIKRRCLEEYKLITEQMYTWKDEDYLFLNASLQEFFIDNQ